LDIHFGTLPFCSFFVVFMGKLLSSSKEACLNQDFEKEILHLFEAAASAFNHLDFVVDAFRYFVCDPTNEIGKNFLLPAEQSPCKCNSLLSLLQPFHEHTCGFFRCVRLVRKH